MKYFLLKSKEQALATPGAYLAGHNVGKPSQATLVPSMFSIIVDENGYTLDKSDYWTISPWMIQQEISPKTHPEYFL